LVERNFVQWSRGNAMNANRSSSAASSNPATFGAATVNFSTTSVRSARLLARGGGEHLADRRPDHLLLGLLDVAEHVAQEVDVMPTSA